MREIYELSRGFVVSYKDVSEPLLFNELNNLYPGIKLLERGNRCAVFYIDNYYNLVEKINNNNLIFAQHIHPFIAKADIVGGVEDLGVFADMVKQIIPYLNKECSYTCQCRIVTTKELNYSNHDLTSLMSDCISNSNFTINPLTAQTAISLTVFNNAAYLGISSLSDNISTWNGGVLFYSKQNDIICRAEFKIEEAFEVFDILVKENCTVLDLGAAPGGWTHYLLKKNFTVDAVDPAELDERVLSCVGVKHYKMTAQEFIRINPEKKYDIIVNDMKMDTNESIDIIIEMSKLLKKDGFCILTLKLPKKQVTKRINLAIEILKRTFGIVKVRQLYYNRSEVTVFAKSKMW